jgi:hypothetical protein
MEPYNHSILSTAPFCTSLKICLRLSNVSHMSLAIESQALASGIHSKCLVSVMAQIMVHHTIGGFYRWIYQASVPFPLQPMILLFHNHIYISLLMPIPHLSYICMHAVILSPTPCHPPSILNNDPHRRSMTLSRHMILHGDPRILRCSNLEFIFAFAAYLTT